MSSDMFAAKMQGFSSSGFSGNEDTGVSGGRHCTPPAEEKGAQLAGRFLPGAGRGAQASLLRVRGSRERKARVCLDAHLLAVRVSAPSGAEETAQEE